MKHLFPPKKPILNPSEKRLRKMAAKDEIRNRNGFTVYHTRLKSRSAAFTEIVYKPNKIQKQTIKEVNDYIKKVLFVAVDRDISQNPKNKFGVRLYVTKEFARLALMFSKNFFLPASRHKPKITIIDIPEWKARKVYVFPKENLVLILGIDYYGEAKMASLRTAMHIMREEKEGLGIHAGSKIYKFFRGRKLKRVGVIIFGLSGTGKTTIICNNWGFLSPEGIEILQDDILMLTPKAFAFGTEKNFYIKTDNVNREEILLKATITPETIAENAFVNPDGLVDFDNQTISANGRAIIPFKKMPYGTRNIDLPRVDIVFFAMRRYDTPPVGKLISPEQAAAFYMLGESTLTSADDPERAGESKRVVGFDPFITDHPEKNGNMLLKILKKNPHIEYYILNTGCVGGGIKDGQDIRKTHTMKIIEEIIRGKIDWVYDPNLGYDVPKQVPGLNLRRFNPYRIYGEKRFLKMMKRLRKERKAWLRKFKGLKKEIIKTV